LISTLIDDYCGTGPHKIPWPWPGPRPWVLPAVAQLTFIAQTLQEGSLRQGIEEAAGEMANRAFQGG
jgi:hypothetical protein